MDRKTEPLEAVIKALIRCANAAEALNTSAGFSVAGRLYVKAWELEHAPAYGTGPDDTSLAQWAAAERARLEAERPEDEPP